MKKNKIEDTQYKKTTMARNAIDLFIFNENKEFYKFCNVTNSINFVIVENWKSGKSLKLFMGDARGELKIQVKKFIEESKGE